MDSKAKVGGMSAAARYVAFRLGGRLYTYEMPSLETASDPLDWVEFDTEGDMRLYFLLVGGVGPARITDFDSCASPQARGLLLVQRDVMRMEGRITKWAQP